MAFDEDEELPEEVMTEGEDARDGEEEEEEDIDPMEAFALLEILEEGTGSTVFQAKHKTNGKLYAIKVLEFGEAVHQAYATLEQEVAQLIELSQASPCVLGYVALCRRDTSLWIVEEFCDGGSAIDAAILLEALTEDQIRAVLYGAIQALLRLHEEGFIHGNLRASNVLLQSTGAVKVADFGQLGLLKRSTYWLSPEYIEDKESITDRSDVWSLGITCMELAEHVTPYHNMTPEASTDLILKGPAPELETKAEWSAEFNAFIARCLVRDPAARPSPAELLRHPFLAQMTEEKMATVVKDMCQQFKQKREMWNDWAREQAKGTGQQVLLLPLCQIKELFYKRLSGEEDEEEEEEGSRTPTAKPGSKEGVVVLDDLMGEKVVKGPGQCTGGRCELRGLIECEVYLLDWVQSVRLEDCTDCVVVVGACRGEVVLSKCEQVQLSGAAQRVRLEACTECNLFLCVMEGPVLSASHGILVGPWNTAYSGATQAFRSAGLDPTSAKNCYRQVTDLSRGDAAVPAPHFDVLEAADVQPQRVEVPGSPAPVENPCAAEVAPAASAAAVPPASATAVPAEAGDGGSAASSRRASRSSGGAAADDYAEDFDAAEAEEAAGDGRPGAPEPEPTVTPAPEAKPPRPKAPLRPDDDDDFDAEDAPEDEPRQRYSDDEFDEPALPAAPAAAAAVAVAAADSPVAPAVANAHDSESSSDDDDFPTIAAPRTSPPAASASTKTKALANFTDEFADETPSALTPAARRSGPSPPAVDDDDDDEFDVHPPPSAAEPKERNDAADTTPDRSHTATPDRPHDMGTPTIEVTDASAAEAESYAEDFDTPPPAPQQRKASVASQGSSGQPPKSEGSAPLEELYDDEFDDVDPAPPSPEKDAAPAPEAEAEAEGPATAAAARGADSGFDSDSEDEPALQRTAADAAPQLDTAKAASDAQATAAARTTKPPAARATRLGSDSESSSDGEAVPPTLSSPVVPGSGPVNRGPTVARLRGERVTRLAGSVTGDAVRVVAVRECEVYLLDALRTALVEDCHGCTVVVGPTAETVCVRDCSDCSITAAAGQVLVENSSGLSLQLYSAQRPVLTASTGIRINTWHCAFPGCAELFSAARLRPAVNLYADVKADAASQYVIDSPALLQPCELDFGEDEFMENTQPDMPAALRALLQTPAEDEGGPAVAAAAASASEPPRQEEAKEEAAPTKPSPAPTPPVSEPAPAIPAEAVLPEDEKLCYVKGKTHRTIVRAKGLDEQQMALDSLQHCTVKLFGPMDSVLVDDCYDCTFLIGPTTGSVMFRDCARLVVACACQQLRTRDCTDVQLYLYCSTDPIVEASSNVRFQTWNVAYPGLTALFKKVGFAPHKNRYRNVFDFNKEDERYPEPHFVVQPIDGSLQLREEFITDFQDRKVEAGEPDIPEALLQVLRGELAAPVGRAADEEGGLSHLDIRTGQAAAEELLEAEEEKERARPPPKPLVLPKEALHDEEVELEDLGEDVGSESSVEVPDAPGPPKEAAAATAATAAAAATPVAEAAAAAYVPRFAMATAEYRANVERARQLEERLRGLREAVGRKAAEVERLLQALAPP